MSQYLTDPDYLFGILTAIVKKSNGRITLTPEELDLVSKGDLIGMYYEPKTGNLVLKEVDRDDMLSATSMVREKKDGVYEN